MASRDIQIPLAVLLDRTDDAAEKIVSKLNIELNEITSQEQCVHYESQFKSLYYTYEKLSKQLYGKYLGIGSSEEASNERKRRNSIRGECSEVLQFINVVRKRLGLSECSDINISMLSLGNADKNLKFNETVNDSKDVHHTQNNLSHCQMEFRANTLPLARSTPFNNENVNLIEMDSVNDLCHFGKKSGNSLVDHFSHDSSNSSLGSQKEEQFNKSEAKFTPRTSHFSPIFKPQSSIHDNQSVHRFSPFMPNPNSNHCEKNNDKLNPCAKSFTEKPAPHNPNQKPATLVPKHHFSTVGRGFWKPEKLETKQNFNSISYKEARDLPTPQRFISPTTNSSDHYIRKMELFKPSLPPFKGESHKFYAWLRLLENEIEEIKLTSIERIKYLLLNTEGEPHDIIQSLFDAGSRNPDKALKNIMETLYADYGANINIAKSLTDKIDSFPNIVRMNQGKEVRELLHLCLQIDSYKDECAELMRYDLPSGQMSIWMKLPQPIQNRWRSFGNNFEREHYGNTPTFTVFISFLREQVKEMCNPNYQQMIKNDKNRNKAEHKALQTQVVKPDKNAESESKVEKQDQSTKANLSKCPLHASSSHTLTDCFKFKNLPYDEKRKILVANRRCFKCTGTHMLKDCNSNLKCDKCKWSHLTVLHNENYKPKTENVSSIESPKADIPIVKTSLCTTAQQKPLAKSCSATVLVELSMPTVSSKKLIAYAILDPQSNCSFVDPSVVKYFNTVTTPHEYSLVTIQGMKSAVQSQILENVSVRGISYKETYKLPPLVTIPSIPDNREEIASPSTVRGFPHIASLAEHFEDINPAAQITVLLGRNCGFTIPVVCHGDKAPYVYQTNLGYALIGEACPLKDKQPKTCLKIATDHEHFNIVSDSSPTFAKSVLPKLPLVEDIFIEHKDDEITGMSAEEENFIQLMNDKVHINGEGHITLPLPFKDSNPQLPNNCQAVYYRQLNILNRLKKSPDDLQECLKAMDKNLLKKFVEPVPDDELETAPGKAWWLPIFPVSHPSKKLRLVYDSKAEFHGKSLNDYLMKGPDENNKLIGVLLRFRKGPIGFGSDVEAMFNQFHVSKDDSNYLRYYWFEENNPDKPLVQYRARAHIFGNKPSPAVANFGLKYAVQDASPDTRDFIFNHVYVDDGLCSTDSVDKAVATLNEARSALSKVGVRLCKIISNSPEVVSAFPPTDIAKPSSFELTGSDLHGTLGMKWDINNDKFVMTMNLSDKPFTMRGVVSTINSIFDPLNILAPVIITGRIHMRQMLTLPDKSSKNQWDKELPDTYREKWQAWLQDLQELKEFQIPRSYIPSKFGTVASRELHTFADASHHATAYVSYLRSVSEDGNIKVAFVCAGAKLAPKSCTSIPRLELCAALQATLATVEIANELQYESMSIHLYSDSSVTLGYILNSTKRFAKYIRRRVSLIRKCSPIEVWNYVPTHLNCADIATRPLKVDELINSRWIEGPSFLQEKEVTPFFFNVPSTLPETIETDTVLKVQTSTQNQVFTEMISRINNWEKIQRVTQKVIEACNKFSKPIRSENLTCLDESLNNARTLLLRESQNLHLDKLYQELSKNRNITDKKMLQWSPFLDDSNIIRVGGRVDKGPYSFDEAHPILVPYDHPLSKVIAYHYHCQTKHQGRLITTGIIKASGYFLQHGSKVVKSTISECMTCRSLRAPTESQRMSDLPVERLIKTPPFTNTGLDVCGPFTIGTGKTTRKSTGTTKVWILLFTCMYSRATHTEILPSMDTTTFINAYRRFTSVRGPCSKLISDCGSNFIGARNSEDFKFDTFKNELVASSTEWELIPPHASHYGGVWERKIGSLKRILNPTLAQLKNRYLTMDEFSTLVAEATSIMNNTPLSEVNHDPNDPLPLTPALLLTNKSTTSASSPLDDVSTKDVMAYGKNRYKRVQFLADYFWKRWKVEYLWEANRRRKWTSENTSLDVNDLVLVRDKNLKRNEWPVALIVDKVTSKDDRVRSVIVRYIKDKTAHFFERPIVDLVLLSRASK